MLSLTIDVFINHLKSSRVLLLSLALSSGFVFANELTLAPLYQSDLHWLDDHGTELTLKEWQGKPVFITMAYSTCKKFCPMTMARLSQLQKLLDDRNISAEIVIISYDPVTDNWKSWAEYRKMHNLPRANWHFLTGSLEDTKTVSQLLGMDFWLYDDHVLHNFKISRIGMRGEIVKSLDWDSKEKIETLLP